ncbi:Putative peptidoglycan binding domain-containing protein [Lentzea albidocapillata subsp. violacea]|uniref:Putative peptidoglycan binding domain-containing protein n=1 Tax=Lentzea albidocapillata subsp. violacea TaxID=128104 RepID=A0A1G9HY08_9PSEU|nr:peptidoglycan-binding domain-containing protein [Lentzea albidocapillata]SDL17564.1 Putative peptidoglycan binding domain-containing protein [Lentzea albidocapillata subsp. violacea]
MGIYRGYEGARSCTGGPTSGAQSLMAWLLGAYGKQGGYNLGIYNCATIPGSNTTSLHGEGRATDLGVPVGAGWAQVLAGKLINSSAELGVQCVIYNRRIWSGSYPDAGWRPYSGTHPHHDHLHVELSWNSARTLTAQGVQQVLGGGGGGGAPTPPTPGQRPTIRRGSTGSVVREVQRILNAWYPSLPALDVDGDFGPLTDARVRYMQSRAGLAVDGVVGPATWRRLLGG